MFSSAYNGLCFLGPCGQPEKRGTGHMMSTRVAFRIQKRAKLSAMYFLTGEGRGESLLERQGERYGIIQ